MTIPAQKIPMGYKQTELGVIPEDWDVKRLGDVADITKLAGFEYTNYFNSYKDGGEIVVIRGTNITHNKLDLTDIRTILRSTSNKLPRSKLSKYDLVFAYVGTIGPVFLIDKNDAYHLGPNTCKITAQNCMVPEFIFTYFNSWFIQNEIVKHTSIGAQPSLSMTKIRKFRIILPSTKFEQTAIATVLSDTDALLERLEKLIVKKKAIKQGAMQQLLTGKKRLPGFSGEWEVKRLDDIFSITAGKDLIKDSYTQISDGDHSFPIYSNSLENKGLYGYTKTPRHKENSITITARGTIGKANARDHKFDAIGRLLILEPVKKLDCFFISEYLNNQVVFAIESTGVPQLTAPQASKYLIAYPDPKEQTAIATVLSDMDAEIERLEQKRDKYIMLKQGMMQQLLTGKIRIYANN